MARHVVAAAAEIPPGAKKLVTVKGREIGVFNVGGEYFALANRCPHAGGPMCEGRIAGLVRSSGPGNYELSRKGEFLRCPWHGWEFDIRTGQSWCDPNDMKIRQFRLAVEDGEALVKGPYVAETFQVAVEEKYIVIDL
ncbi:MAG TPA: Rieske (2Fe-2S) protein [Xanthobacteraceae bacterium]|jgi:3-phenylpropionate/trans-cinnamate dioxygenase ferredoxin subunit|nr:Rieske (2Fe-2S) protein [Xanthobacteraceae bacterium]